MNEAKITSQAAAIFLNAAAYIRKYGWQQKGMGVDGTPRCSMGALASAHPGKWSGDLSCLMYQRLSKELHGLSLTQFNYKYNDGEKVAQLYERVAESLHGF